jgi:hypothetical protein
VYAFYNLIQERITAQEAVLALEAVLAQEAVLALEAVLAPTAAYELVTQFLKSVPVHALFSRFPSLARHAADLCARCIWQGAFCARGQSCHGT